MLVPKFSLQQTTETVVVTIKLPYVRVGDAEVSVVRGLSRDLSLSLSKSILFSYLLPFLPLLPSYLSTLNRMGKTLPFTASPTCSSYISPTP
jgi:hypothetical protein